MKRRDMLIALGLSPVAASSLVRSSLAAEGEDKAKEGDEKMVELLFVQSAHEATLGDGKLTLKGIAPLTLYFSDRPERIVGHISNTHFVDSWSKGKDCFAVNHPNAVLSLLTGKEGQEIVVVLKNPKLQKDGLVYDVEILEGSKTASGGPCSLFIDTIGRPLTPVSFAGHTRRVRRRTRRRVRRR